MQHKAPDVPIQFRGIHLAGNPVARPSMTAALATNVRVMPGYWLRLRGGRRARKNTNHGTVQQIHAFRDPNFPGSNSHLAQVKYTSAVAWENFDLATFQFDPFFVQPINTSYDGGWCLAHPAAVTNVIDRPVFYNGLGVRDGTNSRPPFSSLYAGIIRYFGLDAYCPAGKPTVGFAAGAGFNKVITHVTIYVGIYHGPTNHYSNGVLCGKLTPTTGTGTITVSNLQNLKAAFNNANEQSELRYVFYATVDSGSAPYLIMNAAHDGPLTAPITASSQSLSVEATLADGSLPNGWFLDLTSDMPIENHPPKPMQCLISVNGRLYGIPLNGGSGVGSDFNYRWATRDFASVVWSKASGDDRRVKGVGDPQQSWPLTNLKATPNTESPIWLAPSVNGDAVVVFTPRSTFLMTELSTGMHVFNDITRVHGLGNPMTVRMTDYGLCWLDQRNQVCVLSGDTKNDFKVLSLKYQNAILGLTPTCADYVLSPIDEIDRYQVFFSDGTSLNHDFGLRDETFPEGMAYLSVGMAFTAAATLVDQEGKRYFAVANGGIYTHETQPENGLILTNDEQFLNTTDQLTRFDEINGQYEFNWNSITDWNERKLFASLVFIGDGRVSAYLGGNTAIDVLWWCDFDQVLPASPKPFQPLIPKNSFQTAESWQFYVQPRQPHGFVFKFMFRIRGHAHDNAAFAYHTRPATEGSLAYNFYAAICSAGLLTGVGGNRP